MLYSSTVCSWAVAERLLILFIFSCLQKAYTQNVGIITACLFYVEGPREIVPWCMWDAREQLEAGVLSFPVRVMESELRSSVWAAGLYPLSNLTAGIVC